MGGPSSFCFALSNIMGVFLPLRLTVSSTLGLGGDMVIQTRRAFALRIRLLKNYAGFLQKDERNCHVTTESDTVFFSALSSPFRALRRSPSPKNAVQVGLGAVPSSVPPGASTSPESLAGPQDSLSCRRFADCE